MCSNPWGDNLAMIIGPMTIKVKRTNHENKTVCLGDLKKQRYNTAIPTINAIMGQGV